MAGRPPGRPVGPAPHDAAVLLRPGRSRAAVRADPQCLAAGRRDGADRRVRRHLPSGGHSHDRAARDQPGRGHRRQRAGRQPGRGPGGAGHRRAGPMAGMAGGLRSARTAVDRVRPAVHAGMPRRGRAAGPPQEPHQRAARPAPAGAGVRGHDGGRRHRQPAVQLHHQRQCPIAGPAFSRHRRRPGRPRRHAGVHLCGGIAHAGGGGAPDRPGRAQAALPVHGAGADPAAGLGGRGAGLGPVCRAAGNHGVHFRRDPVHRRDDRALCGRPQPLARGRHAADGVVRRQFAGGVAARAGGQAGRLWQPVRGHGRHRRLHRHHGAAAAQRAARAAKRPGR
ncbi:Uncharacterised protein [Bordetella pertussis]|nr:Uncharacterised protein [Bordetella pertussis]CFM23979.1 Uncharacterised protein [Bordetella pertussis]CFM45892.1 Uncharacterised protein [Bordetella pertussis]CFM65589.1 Uncharacterised protein [Bordetella pertussis]CFM91438.1 Uncharacterised protein [Bordetella pertussis]